MSGSQKTLRVFGVLEIVDAALSLVFLIKGEQTASWSGAVIAFLAGIYLLQASKDASKIRPAWIISLIWLIYTALMFVLSIAAGLGAYVLIMGTSLVLNVIVFAAANNVKKQTGR